MTSRVGHKVRETVWPAALSVAVLCLSQGPALSGQARLPAQVSAVYAISFNGFSIGSFKFDSKVDGKRYALNGDAELSALLGAFQWRGISQTTGKVGRSGPTPSGYLMSFKGTGRSGSIKVGFDRKGVKSASIIPPMPAAADEVPLQRSHLKGAIDPLSAVMALSLGSGTRPCAQKLSIFDGKQRFDLELSYRGQRPAPKIAGQTGLAKSMAVCSVQYRPLGGFRMTSTTKQLVQSDGLEISMLPVPGANFAVPHEIRIPTSYGSIVLLAEKLNVTDRYKRRLALLGAH